MPISTALANDNIIEATLTGNHVLSGAMLSNRFHCSINTLTSDPLTTISSLTPSILAQWIAKVVPLLSVQYLLTSVLLRRVISVARGIPTATNPRPVRPVIDIQDKILVAIPGTIGGTAATQTLSASVRLRSSFSSKYFRGGVHLGPVAIASIDAATEDNLFTVGPAGGFRATANANLSDLFTGDHAVVVGAGSYNWRPVIFSETYCAWVDNNAHPPSYSATNVVAASINPYVRHQLSRQSPHVP